MKKTLLFLFVAFSANGFAQGHMNLDSLFNWQDTSLPPSGAHNNTYNEIWGYAKNGAEYAIIGSTMGTHIFDVTVPSASSQVAFIEGAFTGPGIVHRDFHDHDDYLYMVSDEGSSTLQIADLRFLPDSAPLVYDSPELFPRSHNIFIDTTSARMYVCGGTVDFAVYSLADPTAPTLLLDCPEDVPFWSAIGYVHDVYVKGDTAYLNAGANGLFVVDFSNIGNPQMIGSLDTYVQSGYNHSGWLMKDQPYYALADETHGMDVKIIDVSDMSDLFVTDTIGSDVSPVSIPHNLIYRDNYLFVSYYFDGVYMFDCSNPAHPVLAGFYDTSTEIATSGVYRGCWGVYPLLPSGNILASDMQTGLWVLGSMATGVQDSPSAENQFFIYPNPASDQVYVNRSLGTFNYSVFDMYGKQVATGRSAYSFDVSFLQSGMYVLKLQAKGLGHTTRFIKN